MKSAKCQGNDYLLVSIFLRENRWESNCTLCEEYYVRNYLFSYNLILSKYLLCLFYEELWREISIVRERNYLLRVRTQFERPRVYK